jgi:hypothetical protein
VQERLSADLVTPVLTIRRGIGQAATIREWPEWSAAALDPLDSEGNPLSFLHV